MKISEDDINLTREEKALGCVARYVDTLQYEAASIELHVCATISQVNVPNFSVVFLRSAACKCNVLTKLKITVKQCVLCTSAFAQYAQLHGSMGQEEQSKRHQQML